MAKKFLIECPSCGRINEASTSFFSKRNIACKCGHVLNVKTERMITKQCRNCGNSIVYDRGKTDYPICPVCNHYLNEEKDDYKFVEIICPECNCHIITSKEESKTECPLCGTDINVKERLREQEYINQAQPSLLKSEVNSDVCIWKHPMEDFAFGSQIIVNESQIAIFVDNGKALAIFESGKHVVTKDYFLLSKDTYKEDNVTFHSQLFYLTKTLQFNQRWGTDSKIRMFDPLSGLHVELGAFGTFNYKIVDYEKFLFFVIGIGQIPNNGIKADEVSIKFRPNVVSIVKSELAKTIKNKDINILEVDLYTKEIADELLAIINTKIIQYGIQLTDFLISNIITPDDDPNYKRMKEQYAERYLKVQNERIKQAEASAAHDRIMVEVGTENDAEIARAKAAAEVERIKASASADAYRANAYAEAEEMKIKGYTYQDETRRMVSTGAVKNMNQASGSSQGGIPGIAEDAVKAGMIKQMGREITNDLVDAMKPQDATKIEASEQGWVCPKCGHTGITTRFCPDCGEKKPEQVLWNCPKCGKQGITSRFCPDCGEPMPVTWDCPDCGTKSIKSNFCPNCGRKR